MPILKRYNRNFFKKWSRNMAYVLGFLYADGNIIKTKRGTHFIAIYTADRPLLEDMRLAMSSEHKISEKVSETGRVYKIQIGSIEWFNDLGVIGMTPNKSKRMTLPKNIPRNFIGDFIRGYFDGDGNVWTGKIHKGRKVFTDTIHTAFTSVSVAFLRSLHSVLKNKGIEGGSIYTSKTRNYSRLMFSVRDSLKLYNIMYNRPHKLFLNRKKLVFEKYMSLRL